LKLPQVMRLTPNGMAFMFIIRRARVGHHLLRRAVVMGARLVHDPREHPGFAGLVPGEARKRHARLHPETGTDTLLAIPRACRVMRRQAGTFLFGTGWTNASTYCLSDLLRRALPAH
jgi:hypothetical protein